MRTSKDEFLLPNGTIVALSQDQQPPEGAQVWNGFDYQKQEWVHNGKKDTRTLEELRASITAAVKELCGACCQEVVFTQYDRCPNCSAYKPH